jgi:polysaccharide export outer membrane protein
MKLSLLAFAMLALACTGAQAQEVAALPNSVPAVTQPVATSFPIGPQDTLIIEVFDVPDLSRTVQVENSGIIVLPLIGQVTAAGKTPDQLSQVISAELDQKYLKHAVVTVTVKDAASQRVTVDGEVTQPGLYEIGPHTTLSQAVALAKGPTTVADTHQVAIIRVTSEGRQAKIYDLADIRDGTTVDPFVQPGDTVVVDVSDSRRFVRDFGSVFSTLALLHP